MAKDCDNGTPIDWQRTVLVRPLGKNDRLEAGERLAELGQEDKGKFAWSYPGEIVLLYPGTKIVVKDAPRPA